ncbi:MAG TPA: hypothetical protein [Caudoviricetes sp.]|nr:MAG TPA: hypothetical protein [Caudoviricetes sp.]
MAIDFYIGYRSSLWPSTGGTISGFPIQPYPTPLRSRAHTDCAVKWPQYLAG